MSRFILCENKKKIVKEIMISRIRSLLVVLTMVVVLFNSSISLQAEEYEYDVLDRVVKVSYEDGSYVEYEKEYVLPSGKRVDFIDFESKIVYELKPNNPNQIKKGTKQLAGYLEEIETVFGKGWS